MAKSGLFNKGDIILTNPQEGFWGIAVVLSERERTPEFLPMCHIAITPLVFKKEVELSELNISDLVPLEFEKHYTFALEKGRRKREPFSKIETCIGVYTRRNKVNLKIIGNINPETVYAGPLPFSPDYGLEVTFPLCGDVKPWLGNEATITYHRKNNEQS
jgi:hypothetical protein